MTTPIPGSLFVRASNLNYLILFISRNDILEIVIGENVVDYYSFEDSTVSMFFTSDRLKEDPIWIKIS
jgi:hypothetical protein